VRCRQFNIAARIRHVFADGNHGVDTGGRSLCQYFGPIPIKYRVTDVGVGVDKLVIWHHNKTQGKKLKAECSKLKEKK
jgi:hypothetical protein